MDILSGPACAELEVKHSRFIAETFPVTSPAEAREILKAQKTRYAGASHVVHAFITGLQGEFRGMSDDGEPPGTAARPAMDVLGGRRCTNILLTVTRYFGGVLLGTGGLVKAYGDAARAALAVCSFKPLIVKCSFSVSVPYNLYQTMERLLSDLGAEDVRAMFETNVSIIGAVPETAYETLREKITGLTGGKTAVKLT
jgi:uncharacterized YigZ family protein